MVFCSGVAIWKKILPVFVFSKFLANLGVWEPAGKRFEEKKLLLHCISSNYVPSPQITQQSKRIITEYIQAFLDSISISSQWSWTLKSAWRIF
jgi:hypothetical protein